MYLHAQKTMSAHMGRVASGGVISYRPLRQCDGVSYGSVNVLRGGVRLHKPHSDSILQKSKE